MNLDILFGVVMGVLIMAWRRHQRADDWRDTARQHAQTIAERDVKIRDDAHTIGLLYESLAAKNEEIARVLRIHRDSEAADQLIEETRNAK